MITYEVKITRKFQKEFLSRKIDGEFWWEVDGRSNGTYMSGLSSLGWAKSVNAAKKKALKHILYTEKRAGEDEFGVVFHVEGTAEEVTKALQ